MVFRRGPHFMRIKILHKEERNKLLLGPEILCLSLKLVLLTVLPARLYLLILLISPKKSLPVDVSGALMSAIDAVQAQFRLKDLAKAGQERPFANPYWGEPFSVMGRGGMQLRGWQRSKW
ncbi:MAG: hypothetical protein D6732_27740 [Methanobacteriota archaeon]|nr:MAG: hypothetical protein D6732_27740 [Euryarchaeota archaeon]